MLFYADCLTVVHSAHCPLAPAVLNPAASTSYKSESINGRTIPAVFLTVLVFCRVNEHAYHARHFIFSSTTLGHHESANCPLSVPFWLPIELTVTHSIWHTAAIRRAFARSGIVFYAVYHFQAANFGHWCSSKVTNLQSFFSCARFHPLLFGSHSMRVAIISIRPFIAHSGI